MELTARLIRRITADAPIDPVDPGGVVLFDDNLDGGLDDDLVSLETLINATAIGGTQGASLSFSSIAQLEGGFGVRVNGIDEEWWRYEFTPRDDFKFSFYWHHEGTPSDDAYQWYLYAADGTTVAASGAITSAGKLYIRDGTTGTGAADDLSNLALVNGTWYGREITAGHGSLAEVIKATADTVPTAWDTLACTMTATSFAAFEIGLMNTLTGGGGVAGNVVNQNFDGATTGAPTSTTMPGWTITGTGVLTHSTTHFLEGVAALRSNGTANSIARKTGTPSRTLEYGDLYFYYNGAPTGTPTWMISPLLGDNSAAAFQIGIETTGNLRGRNSTNGTGGANVVAASALTVGNWYRVAWNNFEVAGSIRFRYYTGGTRDATAHASAVETLTFTTTATNFADPRVGQMASVTTAPDIYFERLKVDNAAEPSPIGAGTGAPLIGSYERLKARSDVMPDPFVPTVNPPPSGKLVPPAGKVWFCASTPPTGGKGTNAVGYGQYMTVSNTAPSGLHWYKVSWNGRPTSAELALIEPSGQSRKLVYYGWKVGQGQSMAQIASGGADAEINSGLDGIKTYNHTVFLTLWHEWDNNFANRAGNVHPSAQEAADYVNMFRYVVARAVARGVTNIVWCWNVTGHSRWAVDYEALYPGDDVVDWIFWDPYAHDPDLDFAAIVNETDTGGQAWWTGFYNWATTANTLAASGSRPTGFSGAKPLGLGEWGVDHRLSGVSSNGHTDAECAAFFNSVVDLLNSDFNRLLALFYWNGLTDKGDYQVQSGGALGKAAFAALTADPKFAISTVGVD